MDKAATMNSTMLTIFNEMQLRRRPYRIQDNFLIQY